MAVVNSLAAVARGRALAALAAVVTAAGLAAIPAIASAATARPSAPAGAASAAAAHTGPQLTMLAQRVRAAGLHGQVRHASSITGMVVGAYGLRAAGVCVTAVGRSGSVTASAAPSGAFTIGGLAAGRYTLEYRDCAASGRFRAIWSGGASWQRTAARVLIGAGQVRHVPIMMMPASPAALRSRTATWHRFLANASGRGLSPAAAARTGAISGVVTGNGKRLRGVCVTVFSVSGNGNGYGATTGKHGSFVVRHVPAGRYYVTFADETCFSNQNWLQQVYKGHNSPFGSGFGTGNPVKVVSGKATKGIDGHLRLGGEISGIVTTKSGRRLGGICVDAEGTVAGGFVGIGLPTNGDGSYQVNALFPGKYTVDFSIGCGNHHNYAPAALKPVKITYGTRVASRVRLGPGGVFAGTVRLGSRSGTRLAGICVQANGPGIGIAFGPGPGPGMGATNSAGRYRLIGLGTGTYQVDFFTGCNNTGNYTAVAQYRRATAGKVIGNVNAVLQPGAQISGTVTDSHGHELAGMCILINGPSSGNSPGQTLSDGSYYVNELSAGSYQLGFSPGCGGSGSYAPYWYHNQTNPSLATPIKLARGASVTINAQMQAGASISGTITDSRGRKLTGICIALTSATGLGDGGPQPVTFSERGSYQLTGLTPGQYLVDFGCGGSNRYADQWFPNAPDSGAASAISVSVGQTTKVSAVLRPAGAITGVVRGPSGRPLADVCVSPSSTEDYASSAAASFGGLGATTNSRGAYRLSAMAAGRYRILFSPCALNSRYAAQWYRGQASQRLAKSVTVRSGRTTAGVNATLRLGATVTGRVVNSVGKPLKNACVTAYNLGTGQFGFGSTGKAGTYTMRGLATGRYTTLFSPCNPLNLVTVLRHIKVVAPRTTKGVNARLVAGGSAGGSVTVASSGGPAAQTCVEFISPNPANAGGFALTGTRGRYRAAGIAPGSYRVYFNDPLCGIGPVGLAPQWYNDQPTQATANKVTITVGHTTTGIDASLQADGTITGTVLGPSSAALSGVCVTAMPLTAGFTPVVAISSKSGAFTLTEMLPGKYKVEFSSGCGATGYRTQWWDNAGSRQRATPVKIKAAQTVTGIDATLTR